MTAAACIPPSFKAKTRLASAMLKYEETAHPRDLTFSKKRLVKKR